MNLISLRSSKRMRLRVEDIIIEADKTWLAEDKVEVFERFGEPKGLHLVFLIGGEILRVGGYGDVLNGGIGDICTSETRDSLKHGPSSILVRSVTCDTIVDEDRFDGFGARSQRSEDVNRSEM